MTKTTLLFVLALLVGIASATANAQQIALGAAVPMQSGMIQNVSPAYCELFAFGEKFARATPGTTVYVGSRKGKRDLNPFRSGFGWYNLSSGVQVPIVALCYSDDTEKEYVGAAGTIFQVLGGGYSSNLTWIIKAGDIHVMDKTPAVKNDPVDSRLDVITATLPFPKLITSGWQAIQIVNNSRLPLAARISGSGIQAKNVTASGGILYVVIRGNLPISIDLKARDPETKELVGVWQQQFYSGPQVDITSQNIILQEGSFSR